MLTCQNARVGFFTLSRTKSSAQLLSFLSVSEGVLYYMCRMEGFLLPHEWKMIPSDCLFCDKLHFYRLSLRLWFLEPHLKLLLTSLGARHSCEAPQGFFPLRGEQQRWESLLIAVGEKLLSSKKEKKPTPPPSTSSNHQNTLKVRKSLPLWILGVQNRKEKLSGGIREAWCLFRKELWGERLSDASASTSWVRPARRAPEQQHTERDR